MLSPMDTGRRDKMTIMQPQPASGPITPAEAESHAVYVRRALAAKTPQERQQALAEQLLAFGHRALTVLSDLLKIVENPAWRDLLSMVEGPPEAYREIFVEALRLYAEWMKGRKLTSRPDEAERRALAGVMLLRGRGSFVNLYHYAAQAILELPHGHPLRDADAARSAVLEEIENLRRLGAKTPWIALADALRLVYRYRFADDEVLRSWESLAAAATPIWALPRL